MGSVGRAQALQQQGLSPEPAPDSVSFFVPRHDLGNPLILSPLGGGQTAAWCSVHATGMGAVIIISVVKDTGALGTEAPVSPMASGHGSVVGNT